MKFTATGAPASQTLTKLSFYCTDIVKIHTRQKQNN